MNQVQKRQKKAELEHLGVRIPKLLNERIEDAVYRGEYATKSDLVRVALRQLFEKKEEAIMDRLDKVVGNRNWHKILWEEKEETEK